ncbi:MAG: carbon-nitrogen hydrolase family protein [Rhodobacteraceae bacterium]|nr:carbon-nitrogen hydrolase family protein [Paracoccaceae bacterium]
MRAGLVQLCASDQPLENLVVTEGLIRQAASGGAGFVLTPEVTNIISTSRTHQNAVLHPEADDPTLARLREVADELGIWLLLGSLALKTGDADGRFANRSFLIAPDGKVVARYDKIHMFDVAIDATETFAESDGFRPGNQAVLAKTAIGAVGLTICYDLRFPHLHRDLARAGAGIITQPAAFSPVSGAAHWHVLLRARAIETGAYILAPAQCGDHAISTGKARRTYGHSLAVDPWGAIIADGGTEPGVTLVDLDLAEVSKARKRIPSLSHDRPYRGPA